jgi:hypothetical protein
MHVYCFRSQGAVCKHNRGTLSHFFISKRTRWSGVPVNAGLWHPAIAATQSMPTSQITHFAVRRHAHLV